MVLKAPRLSTASHKASPEQPQPTKNWLKSPPPIFLVFIDALVCFVWYGKAIQGRPIPCFSIVSPLQAPTDAPNIFCLCTVLPPFVVKQAPSRLQASKGELLTPSSPFAACPLWERIGQSTQADSRFWGESVVAFQAYFPTGTAKEPKTPGREGKNRSSLLISWREQKDGEEGQQERTGSGTDRQGAVTPTEAAIRFLSPGSVSP